MERSNPTSKEQWLCRHRRTKRSYFTFKVRRGGHEETPLVQGKRNPSKMVGVVRGHQRAGTLNHNHRKLWAGGSTSWNQDCQGKYQ